MRPRTPFSAALTRLSKLWMAAAILCIGITWAASAGATAVTYHFTQGGFDDGATVTGTFTGADLNSDGELTYGFDPDELTAFNMQFSGNSVVPAFSLGLSDLGGFVWEINLGAYIGDDDVGRLEGIAGPLVGDVYTLYAVGPGPFHLCDDMENCGFVSTSDGEFKSFTTEPVFVNALPNSVPEPSNLGMAMFGLLALGGLLWCERRRLRA